MFSNDIVGLEARGNHSGAGCKHWFDLADTFTCRRGHGDNRDSPFAAGSSIYEIMLSADTGEDACADGVGADLAGKIYFQTGVDGGDARVLCDYKRIVGVCHILEYHLLVIIHEII